MRSRLPLRFCCLLAAAGLLAGVLSPNATAQSVGGTLNIVVPYSAGAGTPDILARLIAHELQERWRQPVVVVNKPGASGNIGTETVARAAPDGRTLLMAAPAFARNVGLFKSLPYDPIKSFTPIIEVAEVTPALVVNADVPATTAAQFVGFTKANSDALNYASPGHGTPFHLAMELFKRITGTRITHVPYSGMAPALQDLVAGRASAMFLPLSVAMPMARVNKIRILGLASKERVAFAEGVPTLGEQSILGMEIGIWNGLLAPAGTPSKLVMRYNEAINDILRTPAVTSKLHAQSITVVGGSPARFGELIQADVKKWLEVVKTSGIKPE